VGLLTPRESASDKGENHTSRTVKCREIEEHAKRNTGKILLVGRDQIHSRCTDNMSTFKGVAAIIRSRGKKEKANGEEGYWQRAREERGGTG